jgi:hypothetical protein
LIIPAKMVDDNPTRGEDLREFITPDFSHLFPIWM